MDKLLKDKKGVGNGAVLTILVIGLLVIIGGGGYFLFGVQESLQQSVTVQETTSEETSTEGIANLKVNAYDRTNNNQGSLVSTAVYCRNKGITNSLITDGTSLSTSARTNIPTTLGETVECISFNGTAVLGSYGGFWEEKLIVKDIEELNLNTYRYPYYLQTTIYNTDGTKSGNAGIGGNVNITLGASQTDSLSQLRIKNNHTDTAISLKGVYFDTVVATNISNIVMSGSPTATASNPTIPSGTTLVKGGTIEYSKEESNYVWELSNTVYLEEFDEISLGSIEITADGDGCTSTGIKLGDPVYIYVYDEAPFRSQKMDTVLIGVQTDADTPVDVGAPTDADGTYIARMGFYCVG